MKKILLIDPNQDMAWVTKVILEQKGFQAEILNEGQSDFMEQVLEAKAHMVLLSFWPEGGEGIMAFRMLRDHQDTRAIPIIFFSTEPDLPYLTQTYGANGYLKKPFEISEMLAVVGHPHGICYKPAVTVA